MDKFGGDSYYPNFGCYYAQYLQDRSEKRKDKMRVFSHLMSYRSFGYVDQYSVNVFNSVPIVFYVNRISSILKDSIQDKKQSLSSVENLTNELERLQSENDALKQQLTAGQALNGLDPFTKSVILDKVGGIIVGMSPAEIKEFLDYIDIFDKYRKFTKGE